MPAASSALLHLPAGNLGDLHGRRSVFFGLRGVLGIVVSGLLVYSHALISPGLWFLGIGFLASNLLVFFLPLSWFQKPTLPYVAFFLDMASLTVILYSVSGVNTESLLLYYLTVFMATLGEDVRKSVGIAFGASAIYIWLRLAGHNNLLVNPEALLRVPLFFVTALSSAYLAQQVRLYKRQTYKLTDIRNALEVAIDRSVEDLARSEDLRAVAQSTLERFRNLVQDLDAIIWEADAPSLQFSFVSRQAEELLGYPAERWIKESNFWVDHLHPEDRERAVAALRQASYAGRGHEFEYRMVAADARVVWLNNILRVVRAPKGRATQLRGVMVDITERKMAEELGRFFMLSFDMLCIAGFDGYFKRLNPAWEKTLGFTTEELLAKPYLEFVHPDDREATTAEGQKLTMGGVTFSFENRYLTKNGSYRWFLWNATPFPEHQLVYAVARDITERKQADEEINKLNDELEKRVIERTTQLATAVKGLEDEITERKRLQEQLLQSQKMEAVGRLAGGVAHDFNNLLTIINGYAQLLLERLSPEDPSRGQVQEIKNAGDRATSLTRQLLAFSRRQVLAAQVLDLNTVVVNLDKMLRRLIGEDIELVTVPGEALGRVKADPGQIEQVILNLAVNARDALPRGGKLTIETANAELDEAYAATHVPLTPGPYVMLAVSDTGHGMDRETQARIFEPFFTTKEKGKGTGLGLATVYGIVKQSGGYIWVYSEPGRGATFKIYLPRIEEAVKTSGPNKVDLGTPGGSETILLVEDEASVRSLVRRTLEAKGYKVIEAGNGADALLTCSQYEGSVDLLVTDVVMPEMSGRELAERLAPFHPNMKVLFMSGYTDDAVVRHGVLEAETAFLQKPFTPDALARKVREALDV